MTCNLWAFLHWLDWTRGVRLHGWAALCDWADANPTAFAAHLADFAGPEGAGLAPAMLAGLLLHTDLRPGDRVLLAGAPAAAGWQGAARFAAALMTADPTSETLWQSVAEAGASVLIAPAGLIDRAAFARPGRASLGGLRLILTTDGPPSIGARRRVFTWVKPDILLLARRGALAWGSPLDPLPADVEWMPRPLPGSD